MALLGCTICGLVLEAPTDLSAGHLTKDPCPDCGNPLRVVDLAEANQLTRERFLAAHWREITAAKRDRKDPAPAEPDQTETNHT